MWRGVGRGRVAWGELVVVDDVEGELVKGWTKG